LSKVGHVASMLGRCAVCLSTFRISLTVAFEFQRPPNSEILTVIDSGKLCGRLWADATHGRNLSCLLEVILKMITFFDYYFEIHSDSLRCKKQVKFQESGASSGEEGLHSKVIHQ
jgi:hypothetical protein